MRWKGREESDNMEDRRGMSPGPRGLALGGGLGGVVLLVARAFLSGDPIKFLQQVQNDPRLAPQQQEEPGGPNDELKQFVGVVLKDTERVWETQFEKLGRRYQQPKLVLFEGQVESACGMADAAVGPFYCPGDDKVYLDLSFFDEMRTRFMAAGDFAQAYVIAHEVGHHVQNQLGISDKVHAAQQRLSKAEANDLSVRLELQADYLAGVWAHYNREFEEPGDLEEALRCAAAIGDDRLQMRSRGYVVPDSFTHGTSAQRAKWFKLGLQSGDIQAHDPFKVDQP